MLEELDLATFKKFSERIEADVYKQLDIMNCIAKRSITGGPAPETVKKAQLEAAQWLERMQNVHQ